MALTMLTILNGRQPQIPEAAESLGFTDELPEAKETASELSGESCSSLGHKTVTMADGRKLNEDLSSFSSS